MDIIIILLLVLTTIFVLDYLIKPKLGIPCPKRLPILGHILSFQGNPHFKLKEWADKHGGVYIIHMLSLKFVVVNNYEGMYECLVKKGNDFAGRPRTFRTGVALKYVDLSTQDNTPALKHMKMRVQTLMKQYGKGMDRIERVVQEIAKECVDKILAGESSVIIDPYENIYLALCKSLTLFVTGKKYPDDHPVVDTWMRIEKIFMTYFSVDKGVELDVFPWLRYFKTKNYMKLLEVCELIDNIFKFIKDEYKNMDDDCEQTVAFGLLRDLEERKNDENFNEERVKLALIDVIIAGTATSTASLYLMLLILACYPDVQQKIFAEIRAVLQQKDKKDELKISLEDKHKMPYTQAFLLEIQRYGTIIPLSVMHKANVDTTLLGKHIPKGTFIIPNIWHLHHSDEYWEEPWKFIPERFLDPEGNLVPSDHRNRMHLMPFGAGPRVCLGQTLAMARLFVLVTTFVQHTIIEPVPGMDINPDVRSFKYKMVLLPDPYKVKFTKRDQLF